MTEQTDEESYLGLNPRRDLEGDFPKYRALQILKFNTRTEAELVRKLFTEGVAVYPESEAEAEPSGPCILQVPTKDYINLYRWAKREHAVEEQRKDFAGQDPEPSSEYDSDRSMSGSTASVGPSQASTAMTQKDFSPPARCDSMLDEDPSCTVNTLYSDLTTLRRD